MNIAPFILQDPDPQQVEVRELRRRLDDFYDTTDEYNAFHVTHDRSALYRVLSRLIRDAAPSRDYQFRVLELGAGRSGYPIYAGENGMSVRYVAQDVTASNQDHLKRLAEKVYVCDIADIPAEDDGYDLIFSTYVFEHVSAPRNFLENVRRLLRPGGWHVIECPRYDVPGYVCPSLRHLPRAKQLGLSLKLTAARAVSAAKGEERFYVNIDPAMFHTKRWFRDSDAVHLVGQGDVVRWHRRNGFRMEPLHLPVTGGWKRRLLTPRIRLALAFQLGSRDGDA